jgi:hypothetical protein
MTEPGFPPAEWDSEGGHRGHLPQKGAQILNDEPDNAKRSSEEATGH